MQLILIVLVVNAILLLMIFVYLVHMHRDLVNGVSEVLSELIFNKLKSKENGSNHSN